MSIPQERDQVAGRALAVVAVSSALLVVACLYVVRAMVQHKPSGTHLGPLAPEIGRLHLETTDLEGESAGARKKREALKRLTSYGWINRDKGVAHIPIERAIDLELEASP